MKRSPALPAATLLLLTLAVQSFAQTPRVAARAPTTAPPAAPSVVKAKYEGGVTGYMKKQTGTLLFNDAERRLVFRDKAQREYFSIPYDALAAIWPDTQARRTTAGTVVSSLPLPYGANMLGLLMRNKQRYMVVQFDDDDTDVRGVTSFKLDNKQTLASVIHTLAGKADLKPRGESFIRNKDKVADRTSGKTPDE